ARLLRGARLRPHRPLRNRSAGTPVSAHSPPLSGMIGEPWYRRFYLDINNRFGYRARAGSRVGVATGAGAVSASLSIPADTAGASADVRPYGVRTERMRGPAARPALSGQARRKARRTRARTATASHRRAEQEVRA